ncbi:MAG: VG15 protein [Blastococcus sp.]
MSSPQPPPPDSQAAQAGLAILVGLAIAKLWPSLDLLHLRSSLPAFKAAVAVEVQRHAQASATMAAQQYRRERVAAGVGGGYTPIPADPPSVEQVAQAVDWAVQPLWDSAIPVATIPDAPEETQRLASSAVADAKARLAAASEKLTIDAGRDTIVGNAQRDRQAKGWARVPEPGACSFCAMLATRGAVYRSEKSASFKSHDHCRCHVEPVFTAYEPSARVREWQALYQRVVTDQGRTGKDARTAFRQALEGREVTGWKGAPTKAKPSAPQAPGGRTQEQIRAELTALETKLPSLTGDQQRSWMNDRIASLRKQLGE